MKYLSKSLIGLLFIFGLTECRDLQDPLDGIQVIVDYNIINTSINVEFVDANTGELISQQVIVRITGNDKEAIVDVAGNQPDVFTTDIGLLALAIRPESNYKPSPDDPVTFTVVAESDGFLQAGQFVSVAEERAYKIVIRMVQQTQPPSGVVVTEKSNIGTVDGNGNVFERIEVVDNSSKVTFTIPEGTQIVDEGGSPLNNNLSIMITYFDNTSNEALASFPGGLITEVNTESGMQQGMFYSAGFVAIELYDNSGRQASGFNNENALLTLEIAEETYNPETSALVQANDEIQYWSYEPNNGQWAQEGSTTIIDNGGTLEAVASLSHLSWWNFDWFWGTYCSTGISISFEANDGFCDCAEINGNIYRLDDNSFLTSVYFYACDNSPLTIMNAPAEVPVYIEWDNEGCSNYNVSSGFNPLQIPNLCENNNYAVDLVSAGNGQTINIDVSFVCISNPDVVLRPSIGAYFRKASDDCWRWAWMENGIAEICNVELGQDYVVGLYYDNQWQQATVTVEQNNYTAVEFELSDDICNDIDF